ncbi:MAG: phosphate-starvation-inducible PsiE family protein [Ferruginibacter sp.]
MESNDKFSKITGVINKTVMRILIGIMTFSLILASLHLIYLVYQHIFDHAPYFLIDVSTLFDIFNLVLVIAVGYELIKSLVLIISSDTIPTIPIIQIAIIAVANKIITLDIKHTEPNIIIGLAILIGTLGLTHFLVKYAKPVKMNRETEV